MHSKTKIVVLHMKELIYTGIFIALGILFILLLLFMFLPKDDSAKQITETLSENKLTASYIPGVYTTSINLNNYSMDIEVVVNETLITSLRLVNLDEQITSMYPLIEPSFHAISEQLQTQQSLVNITYAQENRYTSLLLINALSSCLDKALIPMVQEISP